MFTVKWIPESVYFCIYFWIAMYMHHLECDSFKECVGKPEGKRPLGRPRRRWEDNIKIDLQEVGWSCGDWMELAQVRDRWRALVSTVRNLRVSKMRGISWLAAEPVSFWRRTLLHGVSKYYVFTETSSTAVKLYRSTSTFTRSKCLREYKNVIRKSVSVLFYLSSYLLFMTSYYWLGCSS